MVAEWFQHRMGLINADCDQSCGTWVDGLLVDYTICMVAIKEYSFMLDMVSVDDGSVALDCFCRSA